MMSCQAKQHLDVMAGLVPAISLELARRSPDRDRRVKPGDDAAIRSMQVDKTSYGYRHSTLRIS
jgi:hypothetical protein